MPKSSPKQTKNKHSALVYNHPMLDLKNCGATSAVLTSAMYFKPGLKPAKNAGKK